MSPTARAPGRVNIIGEHTDYNEGFVLPAAIGYYTFAAATPRTDRVVRVASEGREPATFDLDALWLDRRGDWTDYPRGVLIELGRAGIALRGADVHVRSTVPPGAGLSSSASFEASLALTLLEIAHARIDNVALARLCQRAEIEHAGTQCGIMDQFTVLLGQPGCVLLLDTRSLASAPLALTERVRVVICNTMTTRELSSGEFNHRRAECEAAVEHFRRWDASVTALRDITPTELVRHEPDLPADLYRRVRHVVSEDARVLEAAQALQRDDAQALGSLMNASHDSLRSDYEVSSPELDLMVAIARGCEGVYGARMTGGGFGGCTVNLVETKFAQSFRERIVTEYRNATGTTVELYDGTPVAGAGIR